MCEEEEVCTFENVSNVRGIGEDFYGILWRVALVHGVQFGGTGFSSLEAAYVPNLARALCHEAGSMSE